MCALVIETGAVVAGADSFVTAAEFVTYAANRSVTISTTLATQEGFLRKAMTFITGQRQLFQGRKVNEAQTLQWPRSNVIADDYAVDSATIPQDLKDAQCELGIALHQGIEVMPSNTGKEVIAKKLDVIMTQWSQKGVEGYPVLRATMAFLSPYLTHTGLFADRV